LRVRPINFPVYGNVQKRQGLLVHNADLARQGSAHCSRPGRFDEAPKKPKMNGGNVMQHLPKPAVFLGRALRSRFDCSEQPLPEEWNVLLWFLDGAERRRRIEATLNSRQMVKLDQPADVHWMPADQVSEAKPDWGGHERHFGSLRRAIDFVMHELTIAGRANAWITTESGNLTIEQIEKLGADRRPTH
jgi:hypothetical protein